MPNARSQVGATAPACAPRTPAEIEAYQNPENDEALKNAIDETWMDKMHERLCREFARQVIQQERSAMTTNTKARLENIKTLESLQKQLERLARQESARARRKSIGDGDSKSDRDIFLTLERRITVQIERIQSREDRQKAQAR
jgi:hypothetical protein